MCDSVIGVGKSCCVDCAATKLAAANIVVKTKANGSKSFPVKFCSDPELIFLQLFSKMNESGRLDIPELKMRREARVVPYFRIRGHFGASFSSGPRFRLA